MTEREKIDYSKSSPTDWPQLYYPIEGDIEEAHGLVAGHISRDFIFRVSESIGRPILIEVRGPEPEPLITSIEHGYQLKEFLSLKSWPPLPLNEVNVALSEYSRVVKKGADFVIHAENPFYRVDIDGKEVRFIELLTPIRKVVFKKALLRPDGTVCHYYLPNGVGVELRGVVFEYGVWWNQSFDEVWRGLYDMISRWMKRHKMSSASRRKLKNLRGQMLNDKSFCVVVKDLPYQKEWTQAISMIPIGLPTRDVKAPASAVAISKGWLGLRDMMFNLAVSKKISERDAYIISWFAVPPSARMTRRDIKAAMVSSELIPSTIRNAIRGIRQDALDKVIRVKLTDRQAVITTNDLGVVGEEFALSRILLSFKGYARLAGGIGQCDISNRKDGDPSRAAWALNVKISLEENINRSYDSTPEHEVKKSWLLVISPRQLSAYLWPIHAEHTVCSDSPTSSNFGYQCVTLSRLGDTIKQLIDGELKL